MDVSEGNGTTTGFALLTIVCTNQTPPFRCSSCLNQVREEEEEGEEEERKEGMKEERKEDEEEEGEGRKEERKMIFF